MYSLCLSCLMIPSDDRPMPAASARRSSSAAEKPVQTSGFPGLISPTAAPIPRLFPPNYT